MTAALWSAPKVRSTPTSLTTSRSTPYLASFARPCSSHVGAARRGRRRQRVALLAGGAIPYEPHRIDRLARPARGDDDAQPGQIRCGATPGQQRPAVLEDGVRLGQPPATGVDAGEAAHG